MEESQFRMQASVLHLPRQMRQNILRERLYVYLKPGFTKQQCADLIRLNKRGLRPAELQKPALPSNPHIIIPPGHSGPVYIFLGQQPGQTDEAEEENETGGPNWVFPLAIILLAISIVIVLIAINPAFIPPAIQSFLGG